MKKTSSFRLLSILSVIGLLVLLLGQGCTSSTSFLSMGDLTSHMSSGGGNGEPYDTKPDVGLYFRVVPDAKCGDNYRDPDKLSIQAGGATLAHLSKSCAKLSDSVALPDIEFAPYNKNYLGYDGGIFARLEQSPNMYAKSYPLVEAWCRSDGAGIEGRDVVITLDKEKPDALVAVIYEGSLSAGRLIDTASSPRATQRSVNKGKVTYQNGDFRVEVNLDLSKASPGKKFASRLVGQVSGKQTDQVMNCRMGAYFDLQRHADPAPFRILGMTSSSDTRVDAYLDSLSGAQINWSQLPEAADYSVQIARADDNSNVCSLSSVAGSAVSESVSTCALQSGVSYKASMQVTTGYGRIDNAANQPFEFSVAQMPCPPNYIPVPQMAGYTTKDFCVAKYEMKDGGGAPVSQASGLPWTSLIRTDAMAACQSLGAQYDLVSIAEWQSIARNIEGRAQNWSLNSIGSLGGLARGHSDNAPAFALAAGASDDLSCSGTGELCDLNTWSDQKRTQTLSNGEVIWDFAGNVREWQLDYLDPLYGPSNYISQVTDSAPFTNSPKTTFGPLGNYLSLNVAPFGGLGYAVMDGHNGSNTRGGGFADGDQAGIFAVDLSADGQLPLPDVGFRCVFHP